MTMKKTSGRRKIEMKRIEVKSSRQVTFTKRRTGLFRKASELCVLTGAEIVILVQSPGSRVFAFGHPNVDSVIDTYLGNNVSTNMSENPTCMHEEYVDKYLEIAKELEVEKKKSINVEESGGFWWEKSFENLEIDQLEIYIKSMEELKRRVIKRADELRGSSIVDGLLGDQVILPNLDQFLPYNVGVTNEDLMMPRAIDYNSGGFGNYSFGNGELALSNHDYVNHGGANYQVSSDFGTIGVPNVNYFGQGQI